MQTKTELPLSNLEITAVLKSTLKTRGITYKQVAKKLGVSEKTIKRLFRDKDCSLSRLSAICDAIDISLYDLLDFARDFHEPLVELNEIQQTFLAKHPNHFAFLFFLSLGHSTQEIQEKYTLSDISIFRYLHNLDREGFIELGANNRFRLLVHGKLLMRPHGPLHELVKKRNTEFLAKVLDKDGQKRHHFNSSFRYMTSQTFYDLQEELDTISTKYRKIAYQNEMVFSKDKLIPVKWTTILAEYEIFGKWPISEFSS